MVKNWMMLGDEAFDSNHRPIGVIRFTPQEMKNWQKVAWERFADVVNDNQEVKNMVFGCNYLYIGGLFDRKTGISAKDLRSFAGVFKDQLDNIEFGRIHIDYDSSDDTNVLFIMFTNYDPEEEEARCLSKTMCLVGNTIVPLHMQFNQFHS